MAYSDALLVIWTFVSDTAGSRTAKYVKTSKHMARVVDSGPLTPKIRNPKYGNIGVVMKGILVIFHSNADGKRILSLVSKKKLSLVQTCLLHWAA